ncbi:restriction endonuclease subunit S [uncultured Faecalibaculum sp.]|uniref:restriction endonuclease subunit S n=2 Tax=uncultured Faecalibaculum sp. TaxID=1729681 RepID=UPI00272C319A|nr:restriction endonuclease subunit S [uncultured Faecalibaculum sp.]
MAEYKTVRISDICEIVSGSTPKTAVSEYWEGSLKWITPAELDDEEMVVFDTARHISHQAVVDTHLNLLPAGTILFSSRAPIGKVAIAGSPMYCNQGFKNLICSNSVDNKYLYYYLKHNAEKIKMMGRGATFKEISKTQMGNLEIRLPNASVQVHRSKQLNCIDGVIRNKKAQLRKLDEMIRSRFIEMFGDPGTNPYNWRIETIGRIATDIKYGTSKAAVKDGKYPYLRMNNMTNEGYLDLSDLKYIDISDSELERVAVRNGDILFNRTNSIDLVGKTSLFDLDETMVIAGYIIRVRVKSDVLPSFIVRYMNLPYMKQKLKGMAKGAVNQANISAKELQNIPIYVPPINLQNEYEQFSSQIDKSKLAIQKSIDELENLKKKLMQEYFG